MPITTSQTLVVFLRGVNVGGHKSFRPSVLAQELRTYDVMNVGAAGTFIVRKPGPRTKFLAELRRRLPFESEIIVCSGRDLLGLETEHPFGALSPDTVRFVSVRAKAGSDSILFPVRIPSEGEWFVQLIASHRQFVFGIYRRNMKTIGYLGKIDKLIDGPVTTRNWNTILSLIRALKGASQ